MKNLIFISSIFVSLFLLDACSPNISPNTYTGSNVGVVSHVVPAVVVAVRKVKIENPSEVGGLAGTAIGGVGGSALGGGLRGGMAGAVGGAVVGGVVGKAVDTAVNTHVGYEYILRTKKNKLLAVTQENDLQLSVHQHVLVIYGDLVRIVPDTENIYDSEAQ